MPYDCRPWAQYGFVDGIVASIDFPSCWDGIGLRPEDVTYPEGGACPPGFGNVIPRLSERVHYGVMNPLGIDGTLAFQLSSGPPYSMHADFWNTWQQERLDQLVADCLVANVHCGSVDAANTIRWVRQFGTQRYDLANAAAPDGKGGSYTAGFTNFSLDGKPYHHRYDAFPQAKGDRRDRRVRRPVQRQRQADVAEAVRHAPRRRGRRGLGRHGCDRPRRHDARAARPATARRAIRRVRDAARHPRLPQLDEGARRGR